MAHILVVSEGGYATVEIDTTDQVDGHVIARCPFHGEIGDAYNLEDVIQEALIHVEHNHE